MHCHHYNINLQKTVEETLGDEGIALLFGEAPRTLQRFLESIKWDEEKLRDQCQEIVAQEHAHADAIGCVDESGTATIRVYSADQTTACYQLDWHP